MGRVWRGFRVWCLFAQTGVLADALPWRGKKLRTLGTRQDRARGCAKLGYLL